MQSIKRAPLTEGRIFSKMILFVLPIMATGILQLLYNSADSIIVGRFSGDPNALGAVGSTGTVTGLIINILMGLVAGTSVLISQFYGAGNEKAVSHTVHTSITAAIVGGFIFMGIGEAIASPLLKLLGTKPDLFDSALLYVRIVFLGVPALAVFNFGAAIVRSLGDSRTPLIILATTGLLNVALNLVFVILCNMSVAGVALSTIISQYITAIIIVIILMRSNGPQRLCLGRLKINGIILVRMLKIAIPSAIQSSLFAISNMMLQSAVNTFTTDEVSGNAIASTLENFIYITLNSFYTATLTFVGQNYGANKLERTKRTLLYSIIQVTVIGSLIGSLMMLFCEPIAMLFINPNAANAEMVLTACIRRCSVVLVPYFICGYMESFTGFLRGYGYSLLPMASSIFCVCVLRVLWTRYVFPLPAFNSIEGLFLIYPITWFATALFQGVMSFFVYRKHKRNLRAA